MTDNKQSEGFEAAVTRALERQPEVSVPSDFAGRVRAALPAQPHMQKSYSAGRIAGAAAAGGLVIGLAFLAPHAVPRFSSLSFDMELVLLAELAGIAAWLARRDA